MGSERFDETYYARFYEDSRTQVHGLAEIEHLGRGITGFAAWFGAPLQHVLDVGAGTGLLRDWFAQALPAVRYHSVEVSTHAAARYGHEVRDIASWKPPRRYDLVVCQGVLPYLDDLAAERAIGHLAAACKGLLYLEAITRRDYREVCDTDKTDGAVHLRTAAWYRSRLAPHFEQVGAGLWQVHGGPCSFYELERAPRGVSAARRT